MSDFINWLKTTIGVDLNPFAKWLKETVGLELSELFLAGILLLMAMELIILVMRRSRKAKGILLAPQSKSKK